MKLGYLILMLIFLALAGNAFAADWIWAKGNIHAHTTNSDGDSPPQVVIKWYQDHGYQFLAITDHSKMTDPVPLDAPNDSFVLVTGEEIAVKKAKKPIHGNAVGITATIDNPDSLATPAASIANMVEYIRKSGGIPQVNHPNFGWSFGHRELLQVKDPYLLEIFNGHPAVNNAGNFAYLPVEQTWDILLSNGKMVYATATDDAHGFKTFKDTSANPGRGWLYVHVPELTPKAILDSLAKGDFYASTGVELAGCSFDGKEFKVQAKPGQKYLIRFVGKWGSILQETMGTSASYRLIGKPEANAYIRCKVISSDGKVAWTQAYRIKG